MYSTEMLDTSKKKKDEIEIHCEGILRAPSWPSDFVTPKPVILWGGRIYFSDCALCRYRAFPSTAITVTACKEVGVRLLVNLVTPAIIFLFFFGGRTHNFLFPPKPKPPTSIFVRFISRRRLLLGQFWLSIYIHLILLHLLLQLIPSIAGRVI